MYPIWLHRVLAWQLDSPPHLLRQVHQHIGIRVWMTDSLDGTPTTYETLCIPDLEHETQHDGSRRFTSRLAVPPEDGENQSGQLRPKIVVDDMLHKYTFCYYLGAC